MALINTELCIRCGNCVPYCPMGAISIKNSIADIDQIECVECGVCFQNDICPTHAIYTVKLEWPRILRQEFSNPKCVHKTGVPGRGTEEMKTNDVTNRFKEGEVGIAVEMGRPGTGSTFREIEKITMALASIEGIAFEQQNPLAPLIINEFGKLRDDVLDEKVLSGIVEVLCPIDKTKEVLLALKKVEPQINTVFSVCMITKVYEDGSRPPLDIAREMGIFVSPNCKTNLGLAKDHQNIKEG